MSEKAPDAWWVVRLSQDPKIASQRRERKKLLRGTHRERQIASRNHDQSLQQRGYLPDRRHRNVPHIWFRIRRGRRWVTPEIHREDKTYGPISVFLTKGYHVPYK